MKMPTVMKQGHDFGRVPSVSIERSTLDRSHGYKTTFSSGNLIPFLVDEVLPGDTIRCSTAGFLRLSTPLKPIMDNMYVDTHYFFVPWRLVWTNFVKFMGERTNPADSISFLIPVFTAHIPATGSLSDYFGIPCTPQIVGNIQFNSLYHRAYQLIYNEWFRDQNLINSVTVDLGDGPDTIANYAIRRRGKRHDYFTSCLASPQKGIAVSLPLGTSAPVVRGAVGFDQPFLQGLVSGITGFVQAGAATDPTPMSWNPTAAGSANEGLRWGATSTSSGLVADLSLATAASINELRQAFQIQKLLERDSRGGTRYTELVLSHFRVHSPDARLNRPEYLGGATAPIMVSPVAQTVPVPVGSGAPNNTPQGNLAAIGTGTFSGHGFAKSFTEHGCIIGLVSTRADLTYQQGLERMWKKSTRYDIYWPELSHIGEQAVLRQEIYMTGTGADDNTVFGYQERYAEYRYKPSKITGLFNSTNATPLDVWHLSQEFSGPPTLGQTFIEDNPPVARIKAVSSEPDFLGDFYHTYVCARPMPVFGVPGFIDHF